LKGIRRPKLPCKKCLNDPEATQKTEGYVLVYCPHNRAGLITSMGEANSQMLDVVLSPIAEKEFKRTVVSVLLNNALRESRQVDQLLDACEIRGNLGTA
jgi:hypothetical protein